MPSFLFCWENKFGIHQTIHKRKEAFIKKYGPENFFYYPADQIKTDKISNAIFSWWLFASKKLIIIFWYPKDTDSENKIPESEYKKLDEFIQTNIEKFPSEDVIVFVSYSPDKRAKAFKFLKEKVEVKTFNKPKEKDLYNYIKQNLPWITEEATRYLIEKCWDNMFRLEKEINKIKFYILWKNKFDRNKIIDLVVFSQENIDQFKLLDKIILNNSSNPVEMLASYEHLFVTTIGDGTLYKIDITTHKILDTLKISDSLHGISVVNNNLLVISNSSENKITYVDKITINAIGKKLIIN